MQYGTLMYYFIKVFVLSLGVVFMGLFKGNVGNKSSHRMDSVKRGVFENFCKFYRKTPVLESHSVLQLY